MFSLFWGHFKESPTRNSWIPTHVEKRLKSGALVMPGQCQPHEVFTEVSGILTLPPYAIKGAGKSGLKVASAQW